MWFNMWFSGNTHQSEGDSVATPPLSLPMSHHDSVVLQSLLHDLHRGADRGSGRRSRPVRPLPHCQGQRHEGQEAHKQLR